MNRPSFGRALAVRGLDQFDTPPVALDPLFARTAAGGRARRIAAVPDGFLYRRKHTPGGSGQHCKGRRFPRSIVLPRVDSGRRYWLRRQGVKHCPSFTDATASPRGYPKAASPGGPLAFHRVLQSTEIECEDRTDPTTSAYFRS